MRRLVVLFFVLPLLLTAFALPAAADDSVIELSRDGVTWGPDINEPLFDPAMRWVPGDSETSSFYVRNNGGSLGDLAIDVIAGRAGELIDSGDLSITAMGGGGTWQTINDGGQHRLLTALDLADGKVARIMVKVDFDASSLGDTQLESAPLKFVVTLSRAASLIGDGGTGGAEPGSGGGKGSGSAGVLGLLPDTGAPGFRWVALAAILLGCGSALLIDDQRERRRG